MIDARALREKLESFTVDPQGFPRGPEEVIIQDVATGVTMTARELRQVAILLGYANHLKG